MTSDKGKMNAGNGKGSQKRAVRWCTFLPINLSPYNLALYSCLVVCIYLSV